MYIYKKDSNKEPTKLLIKLFIGGIASCFITLHITNMVSQFIPLIVEDYNNQTLLELIIHAFVGVALIEEGSKWIIVYSNAYNDREFDEIYDMIVYSVFVALGFAFFENIIYIFSEGIRIAIVRALLSIPAHTCNGIFMGYYLMMAKMSTLQNDNTNRQKYLILSALVPTIMHGIFDYCLFIGNILFFVIFCIFVVIMYVVSVNKVISVSKDNKKIMFKNRFCPKCGRRVDSNFCPSCGNKNE
ncbi:MAG: PrsW family intramembrane metalloprotease [Bacilli bacterium]|nr:PrsW family intramembrane metalloprotease [Bacilli bacterium]